MKILEGLACPTDFGYPGGTPTAGLFFTYSSATTEVTYSLCLKTKTKAEVKRGTKVVTKAQFSPGGVRSPTVPGCPAGMILAGSFPDCLNPDNDLGKVFCTGYQALCVEVKPL